MALKSGAAVSNAIRTLTLRRPAARAFRFRPGKAADLAVLLEIDADASVLFERAGLFLDLPDTHEFSVSERARLHASLVAGGAIIAMDEQGIAAGFVALGMLGALPYVEQISVRTTHMRVGLGAALLDAAFRHPAAHRGTALWLTTYDHLPWNRPFYEHNGFVAVPEQDCGAAIRSELEFQRRWLPLPAHRIAMRRGLM
jgi:GNAT superfamily N-acetyltransferase